MVKTIFKIIFLVIVGIAAIVMLIAPLFFSKQSREDVNVNRKITKIRLIAMLVGAVALLLVIIIN